jgi:hypothetical protein
MVTPSFDAQSDSQAGNAGAAPATQIATLPPFSKFGNF